MSIKRKFGIKGKTEMLVLRYSFDFEAIEEKWGMSWTFSTDGPTTLNGLILEYLEMIPEPGISLVIDGYPIEIVSSDDDISSDSDTFTQQFLRKCCIIFA